MEHSQTACAFLAHARAGNVAAARALVTVTARHHNMYFPAGMDGLIDAIADASRAFPASTFTIKRIVTDADMVVIHSHVTHTIDDLGMSVVHMFRFEHRLIAELWDIGQRISPDCPNSDGLF